MNTAPLGSASWRPPGIVIVLLGALCLRLGHGGYDEDIRGEARERTRRSRKPAGFAASETTPRTPRSKEDLGGFSRQSPPILRTARGNGSLSVFLAANPANPAILGYSPRL
jgi:hypothetical protein